MSNVKLASLNTDPRQFILDKMGDLSGITVLHNLLLVKIYERPPVTRGGIYLPDEAKVSDLTQGIAGLVLKVGPDAFVDDDHNRFHGLKAEVGDWVVFQMSDGGRKINVNGQTCKWLQDANIKAIVADPEMVF